MASTATEKRTGPIEDQTWATKLQSRVVTPEASPRIHGYDVENDLAEHYGFADSLMLAALGDLPNDPERRAIEIALHFLAPMSVAHAPSHAGMLTRLCGATQSASFAAGAYLLAEDARVLVEAHTDLIAYLADDDKKILERFAAKNAADRASVARLRKAIAKTGVVVPALDHDLSRDAALLSVLVACGARAAGQLELFVMLGRFACVAAEALATTPTQFRNYPISLPPFRFEAPHVD
jgi:hypothetical protein